MKQFIVLILSSMLFFACKQDVPEPPSRGTIITLAPHMTEIIYALGAGDSLIAVTDFCKYPDAARFKEKIGGLINPNIEKIVELDPAFLFGLPAHGKLDQEIRKFGLRVTMLPNETVEEILKSIDSVGVAIGRQDAARRLSDGILDSLQVLKESARGLSGIKAMLVIGREKGSLRNLMVASGETYFSELWTYAGGDNVFEDLQARYGQVNVESIIERDPDIIIEFDSSAPHSVDRREITAEWQILDNVSAVKNKNIFLIGGDHCFIPGPRILKLSRDFHSTIAMASGR